MRKIILVKKTAFVFAFLIAVTANTTVYSLKPGYVSSRYISGKTPPSTITTGINSTKIDREQVLRNFLKRYDSPMIGQTKKFIEVADKYSLDWRLLPSIAGMESTFGRFLIEESYNPFGWGGGYIYFDSFEEGIETVGRELAVRFKEHTAPEEIGPTYTPPNFRNWIKGVNFFMQQMNEI